MKNSRCFIWPIVVALLLTVVAPAQAARTFGSLDLTWQARIRLPRRVVPASRLPASEAASGGALNSLRSKRRGAVSRLGLEADN